MTTIQRILALALATAVLAGCSKIKPTTAPKAGSGAANFSEYVAMGTSISAGWQSGGLVDRHQRYAFPVLFARQAGLGSFEVPWVNGDGLPALARLVSLAPLVITNVGRTDGVGTNTALATAYDNMAVPYATLFDVGDASLYTATGAGIPPARPVMFNLIVRGRGTILTEVLSHNPKPTFVTFEFGSNEVLGPASNGSSAASLSAAQFAAILTGTLNALEAGAPGVKGALFTVPDVTSIPLVTTIPPLVLGANGRPIAPLTPIRGAGGSAPDSTLVYGADYVLLTAGPLLAQGFGYPVGTTSYVSGTPVPGKGVALPGNVVLDATEVATLRATIAGYNAAIRSEAAARGWVVVDLAGLLEVAKTTGFEYQGTTFTSAFLTGGLFSLDGVHPTDLAHAVLCNALIDAVNAKFGASLVHVNVLESMTSRSDGAVRPRFEGAPVPARNDAVNALPFVFPWRSGRS